MLRTIALGLVAATAVLAQTTCDLENKCPEDAPCCSRKRVQRPLPFNI